jgi:hypothetical protein
MARAYLQLTISGTLACITVACAPFEHRHTIHWNAEQEIWQAEASQVKVRDAQSRFYDTTDKKGMLEAVVATFQDLGFQVGVLDETLGIVTGKKFIGMEKPGDSIFSSDPTYYLYDEEALVAFTSSYRTWGPFHHRSDLVRLTVTVRSRNEKQLLVRASAQFYLQPVEDSASYQAFFRTLEGAMRQQQARLPADHAIP